MIGPDLPLRLSVCPICGDDQAFIDRLGPADEYYVECLNCRVYRASRRTLRHFEYLRGKADPQSLLRLAQLATALRQRERSAAIQLDYDSWQELIAPPPSTRADV